MESDQELLQEITAAESKALFDRAIETIQDLYADDPFKDFIVTDELGYRLQVMQHYILCNNHWKQKDMISEEDYTYRLRLATQAILLLGYIARGNRE